MKHRIAALSLLLAAPVLASCAGSSDDVATDPAASDPAGTAAGSGASRPSDAGPMPTDVPAAPGLVRTRDIATVLDDGRPILCLGAVAESAPPQCGGPALEDWSWPPAKGDRTQDYVEMQGVRWGSYAVTGTFDGTTVSATARISAALYDVAAPERTDPSAPVTSLTDAELGTIADEVGSLPGAAGAVIDSGRVRVDVLYDDGSLQAWADDEYGEGVVLVTPQLLDVED